MLVEHLKRVAALSDTQELWERYLAKIVPDISLLVEQNRHIRITGLTNDQQETLHLAADPQSHIGRRVRALNRPFRYTEAAISNNVVSHAFTLLNDRLKADDDYLEIICAGGYVLQLLGIRATSDVDAFYKTTGKVDRIINSVGVDLGINSQDEVWLNNSIQNLNDKPPKENIELVNYYSNLRVYVVKWEYLVGMKLSTFRDKDVKDVCSIIRVQGDENPKQLYKLLRRFGFRSIDYDTLFYCYVMAHGFSWATSHME